MTNNKQQADLAKELGLLKPRDKEPNSTRVFDSWIAHIENSIGAERSGRLSWLVASTVVTAMLQQVIGESETSRFLLKGGTLLQHRLDGIARATKDLDGIVRGDIDDFLVDMERVFEQQWGPFSFECGYIELIKVPSKIIKPRKLDVSLILKGKTWRKITVEISPAEGKAASNPEPFLPPSSLDLGYRHLRLLLGLQ